MTLRRRIPLHTTESLLRTKEIGHCVKNHVRHGALISFASTYTNTYEQSVRYVSSNWLCPHQTNVFVTLKINLVCAKVDWLRRFKRHLNQSEGDKDQWCRSPYHLRHIRVKTDVRTREGSINMPTIWSDRDTAAK